MGFATALSASGVRAGFNVEIVLPTQNQISSPKALSYNSAGNPSIAYEDGAAGEIRLASKSGGTWSFETIDTRNLIRVDHTYDSSGTAAVAYTTTEASRFSIYYAEKIAGSWQSIRIRRHIACCVISLAFDGSDVPSVVYDKSNRLYLATRPGSSWVSEVVASQVSTVAASLAYDGSGNPNIVFIDDQRSSVGLVFLKLATRSGSTWSIETITSTSDPQLAPNLVFDPTNGEPTVLFSVGFNLCVTRFARKSGGSWQIEDAVSAISASLALDSTGTPHVGYVNNCGDNDQLFVAHKSGGSWISELVDSSTVSSAYSLPSLRIGGGDNPSVSYTKRAGIGTPRDLRFAGTSASCGSDAECDDGNDCTDDSCVASSCENTVVGDNTNCNGGAGICCSGGCSSPCDLDIDCDDSDICTDDFCLAPGACSASCDNVIDVTNDPSCDCIPTHNNEKGPRCSDGIDNDCDGLTDEDDPDC